MARPKKKNPISQKSMNQLLKHATEFFQEPYDDWDIRDPDLPSVRSVAKELDTTIFE